MHTTHFVVKHKKSSACAFRAYTEDFFNIFQFFPLRKKEWGGVPKITTQFLKEIASLPLARASLHFGCMKIL